MAGSLTTVPSYLNVRKRAVLCKAAVRLKCSLNCGFRQPFSMKPAHDRLLLPKPRPPPQTSTRMSRHLPPKSHLSTPKTLIENPIGCCSEAPVQPSVAGGRKQRRPLPTLNSLDEDRNDNQ
jgi:hypothetical protein